MVCLSEGMTLTININQMKLFNAIAAPAAIPASFIVANPAEAQSRNGWIFAATSNKGSTLYVKPIGCNGSICTAHFKRVAAGGKDSIDQINCSTWYYRALSLEGQNINHNWTPIMPESIYESGAEIVCR